MITPSSIKELSVDISTFLSYDKDSGLVTWIKKYSKVKAGDVAGRTENDGYIRIGIKGRKFPAHRIAWFLMTGEDPKLQIDHINGNRSDNRWCNLREATDAQNKQNRRKAKVNNKTGVLGVTFNKSENKFIANIRINGKLTAVGRSDSAEAAGLMYLEAKRKYHEFCTI